MRNSGGSKQEQQVPELGHHGEPATAALATMADVDGQFKATDGSGGRSLSSRQRSSSQVDETRPVTARRQVASSTTSTPTSAGRQASQHHRHGQISAAQQPNIIKRILINSEQQESIAKRSTSPPLIHTDQLNATTRLLFVHSPPLDSHTRHVLAMTSGSQLDTQMAESSPVPILTGDQQLVARLDVHNLQVSSSSATLTWTVKLHPSSSSSSFAADPQGSPEQFHSTVRVRRDENSAPDEEFSELEREKDEHQDLRRRNQTGREADDHHGDDDNDHEEYHKRLLEKSTSAPVPDLLRHRANIDLSSSSSAGGARVRPLPASAQPVRRPPPRVVQVLPVSSTSTTTTTSTTTSTTRPPQRASGRPSSRRPKKEPTPSSTTSTSTSTTTSTSSPSLQVADEPPMPRVPSVQINRIQPSSTSTTLRPPKLASREGKSLAAPEESKPTTTTTTTTTSTTTSTTTTPSPTVEREDSESTIKSVRVTDPPEERQQLQPSGSTKSPQSRSPTSTTQSPVVITTLRHQLITGEHLEAPTTSKAKLLEPASSAKPKPLKQTPIERPNSPPNSSRWLVRLRRFASNEVDIVKVVVNNLQVRTGGDVMRQISFKNLEPSSGYEICVESGQLNQQVADKYHILNANHFLKCQDTSDVELSSVATTGQDNNSNLTMRRMDLIKRTDEANVDFTALNETLAESGPSRSQAQVKVKSLCREFFTLPAGSPLAEINFGQQATGAEPDQATLANLLELNSANSTGGRKPKSLINQMGDRNALKSHMELMEIDDALNDKQRLFEMPTNSRVRLSNVGRIQVSPSSGLSNLGGDSSTQIATNVSSSSSSLAPVTRPASSAQLDYLSTSILPIIGCVFALVFIATLANMILNVMNFGGAGVGRSSSSGASSSFRRRMRRHRSPTSQLSRPGGPLSVGSMSGRHLVGSGAGVGLGQPGSGYYSGSDHSGTTSQTRIVVVGDHCEPFAASSGYFDVPLEQHSYGKQRAPVNMTPAMQRSESLHSSNEEVGKQATSAYLLSDAARFPLGPSFEGDEKHNADMVGLARRNYDNFINNIYNDHIAVDELSNAELHSNRATTTTIGSRSSPQAHLVDCAKHEQAATSFRQQPAEAVQENANSGRHHQQRHQLRHRIRFDKVNPIYNMDAINQQACSRTLQCRPMSSFQNNSATSNTLGYHQQQQHQQVRMDDDARCELCDREQQQEQENLQQQDEHHSGCSNSQAHCDMTNTTGCQHEPEQPYFKCCLDRQKQRFQAQQQQLERVVSKNGSLIPQPFINNTPVMGQPGEGGHRDDDDYAKDSRGVQEESIVSLATSLSLGDNSLCSPAASMGQQHDRALHEVHTKPKDTFVFGEDVVESTKTSQGSPVDPTQPPPPPPPPLDELPTVAASSAGKQDEPQGQKQRPLVSLVSSTPVSRATNDETIDKRDFNRRRSELESKLYLPGMTKQ